jgi:hypothetical protein
MTHHQSAMHELGERLQGTDAMLTTSIADILRVALQELMLPDAAMRDRVADACPRVPRAFWEHEIPLPVRWAPAGFVALGMAYRQELERAAGLGGPWARRRVGQTLLCGGDGLRRG